MASIVTLAIGIGALAAIGNVFYAVYLRPFPFTDSERLAAITEYAPRGPRIFSSVSGPTIAALQREQRAFERLAVFRASTAPVLDGDGVRYLAVLLVDTGFAAVLDVRPRLGRFPSRQEIESGSQVVAISDRVFRSLFAADSAAVIGRALTLAGTSFTVVGVMPPDFRFPSRTDVWLPLAKDALSAPDGEASVVGKIKRGFTRSQVRAELAVVASHLQPSERGASSLILQHEVLDRSAQNVFPQPGALIGIAVLVLLAAVTNVTNLFMARATARRGEMALRASLGATHFQLVRLMLIESLLLSMGAVVCGVATALLMARFTTAFLPTYTIPPWVRFDLDPRLLASCVGLGVVIALSIGLAPARHGSSDRLMETLRGASGGSATSRLSGRLGASFQIAMGVVLVIGCALLVRSYARLGVASVGYPAARILQLEPQFDLAGYSRHRAMLFVERHLPELESLAGVAGIATRGYYLGERTRDTVDALGGRPDFRLFLDGDTVRDRTPRVRPWPRQFVVDENYFALLGLRVEPGRGFTRQDVLGSRPVVVLSRAFASELWGGKIPLGRQIQVGARGPAHTVIGVVDDVNDVNLTGATISFRPSLDAYFYAHQSLGRVFGIYIRVEGDIGAVQRAVVDAMRRADPTLFVRGETMRADLDRFMRLQRKVSVLVGAFAAIVLGLSAVGLYALVAYNLALRTREMAIRIALGAKFPTLVKMIIRESVPMLLLGLAIGLVVAFGAANALRYFIYDVPALDPISYVAAVSLMAVLGTGACAIPMWAVRRIDINRALRE